MFFFCYIYIVFFLSHFQLDQTMSAHTEFSPGVVFFFFYAFFILVLAHSPMINGWIRGEVSCTGFILFLFPSNLIPHD